MSAGRAYAAYLRSFVDDPFVSWQEWVVIVRYQRPPVSTALFDDMMFGPVPVLCPCCGWSGRREFYTWSRWPPCPWCEAPGDSIVPRTADLTNGPMEPAAQ